MAENNVLPPTKPAVAAIENGRDANRPRHSRQAATPRLPAFLCSPQSWNLCSRKRRHDPHGDAAPPSRSSSWRAETALLGGPAFAADAAAAEACVEAGNLAFWFPAPPPAGSQPQIPDGPAPHVAVDAATGTILSSRMPCDSAG